MVETSTRFVIKKKIDRQLAGQSGTTPFMKMNENQGKKSVKFDTLDTWDRTNDNIERLASHVDNMSIKRDTWDTLFKPQIYQKQRRGQNSKIIIKMIIKEEKDHIVGKEIMIEMVGIEENIIIIDGLVRITLEESIDVILGMIIDRITIEGIITEISMEIGVQVEKEKSYWNNSGRREYGRNRNNDCNRDKSYEREREGNYSRKRNIERNPGQRQSCSRDR